MTVDETEVIERLKALPDLYAGRVRPQDDRTMIVVKMTAEKDGN